MSLPDPRKSQKTKAKPAPPKDDREKMPEPSRTFDDPVNETSDESFPASDPPSWTDTAASRNGN